MHRARVLKTSVTALLLTMPLSASFGVERPARPTPRPRPTLERPARPTRPPRAPRPDRGTPTPPPVATPTPTASAPTPEVHGCREMPPNAGDTRLNHIFYAYPGADRALRASGSWRVPRGSTPIDFSQTGSVSLLDSQGGLMVEMADLHFLAIGDSTWAASTSAGFVSVQAVTGGYSFSVQFDDPTDLIIPPDLYSGGQHLCVQIGDDGAWERFVCQIKPNGGFLCHE